jgi:hypothetical protein
MSQPLTRMATNEVCSFFPCRPYKQSKTSSRASASSRREFSRGFSDNKSTASSASSKTVTRFSLDDLRRMNGGLGIRDLPSSPFSFNSSPKDADKTDVRINETGVVEYTPDAGINEGLSGSPAASSNRCRDETE